MDAAGSRPLLVIWIRHADNTPATELDRRKQYYEDLIFGRPDPSRGYPERLRQLEPSVNGYYQEVSNGKFGWRRAGFIGPITAAVSKKSATDIAQMALRAAATEGHFNFAAFDTNHDGKITDKELAVLVIVNEPQGQANHFDGDGLAIPGQHVTFAGKDAVTQEGGNFVGFNHELMHGLGAIDLYGPWNQFLDEVNGGCYYWNNDNTLMGGGGGGTDDLRIYNLDPWHKIFSAGSSRASCQSGILERRSLPRSTSRFQQNWSVSGRSLSMIPPRAHPSFLSSNIARPRSCTMIAM